MQKLAFGDASSSSVLELAQTSNRSAYDCEFVALAQELGLKLLTTDEPIIHDFPRTAIHLQSYVAAQS